MPIAAGQPISSAEVAAAINGAQTAATAANTKATTAATTANAANTTATTAVTTANAASDKATTAAFDIATTNATLNTVQVVTNTNQGDLVAVKSTQATDHTTLTALQTSLDALNSRVAVLETATPPPATPNAVATFSLGATTNTTQVLSWTAPSSGAAPTFYDTRYKPAGTATWSAGPSVAAGTVTATVTGLTSGANYDYSVVTRNAAGPGVASATLTRATTTAFTPSPAGTTIPPAATIIMDNGGQVTVVNGVIFLNGVAMGNTNSVILVYKHTDGRIFQENSFLDWWYYDGTQTQPWIATTDPRVVAPPSGGPNVPSIASNVGYNTLTFGPDIRVGGANPNWFIKNGTAVQQGDGAWRLISADGYGGGFVTAIFPGGYMNFTGTGHGGGLYVRFRAKWQGPGGGGVGGWPGLWSNDIEGQTGPYNGSNTPMHYPPGGPADSNIWMEPDLMEDPNNFGNDYGAALHFWYGNPPSDLQATPPRFTWPNGSTTRTSYHYYGMLWVPATPSTRGYIAYTFDDVEWIRATWDYRADRNTLPYPPTTTALGGNVFLVNVGSEVDWRHFYWEAGSGSASPVDLLSVEVFQASTAGNITH